MATKVEVKLAEPIAGQVWGEFYQAHEIRRMRLRRTPDPKDTLLEFERLSDYRMVDKQLPGPVFYIFRSRFSPERYRLIEAP